MITRSRLFLIGLLIAAGILTSFKIPMASSQGVVIVAKRIEGVLPVADVTAAEWEEATAVSVPLSAQIVAKPVLPETNIKEINVRALYNDEQIAFLVEWADETKNDSTIRVQDFSDAVAIQFPLVDGQPFFCMGQQGGNVNIWHWKADWQAKLAARQDVDTVYPNMYVDGYTFADESAGAAAPVESYEDINYVPALAVGNLLAAPVPATPVEDLIAGSFGSLTSQPADMQNVSGYGEYNNGKWRVIFVRDRTNAETEDAQFETGKVYSLAFAAWDGANGERNGQKSTSQWVSLELEGAPEAETETETTTPSTAPVGPSGERPSSANTLEGLPYIFVPMLIVVVLILGIGAVLFLISKLPDKK